MSTNDQLSGARTALREVNRATVRRAFEIISSGAADRAAEVVTDEYVNHAGIQQPPQCRVPGPAGFAAAIRWINAVFSDLRFNEKLLVCDENHAAFHCVMTGRQTGTLGGIAPTGRAVSIAQTHLFRMAGGRIAEHWLTQDDVGLLQQIGVPAGTVSGEGARNSDEAIDRYLWALVAGDPTAAVAACADDVVHEVIATPESEITQGRDHVRSFYEQHLQEMPIVEFRLLRRWHGDGIAIIDALVRATVVGFVGGDRRVTYRNLSLLEFRDGKIARITLWIDLAAIEKQLQGQSDALRS
ncbi:MAG TPA: ester cyclase [Candidatus Dormibacteraeota bacterium]|nr:ester cyclase [Candidatus Dormibacteraeota bacterium]